MEFGEGASSSLPPEIEEGNIEYKVRLVAPSVDRFQQLVTQLKWRLGEGNGEAIYELGVSDGGMLVGMTAEELRQSLDTLQRMAQSVGAEISVVRERAVSATARELVAAARSRRELSRSSKDPVVRESSPLVPVASPSIQPQSSKSQSTQPSTETLEGEVATATEPLAEYKVAEVLVRRLKDVYHFLEVRVAFLGSTDAGKSTLLGYLSCGELDNGRGMARLNLLRHRHEIQTGRSSSISHTIIGFDSKGNILNRGASVGAEQPPLGSPGGGGALVFSESEIVDLSAKIVMLIDTCGHPKYLRTTIHGISAYKPDYACLVLDGNAGGIDATTKELLGCAMVLSVPVFVVLTKIDQCSKEPDSMSQSGLKDTLEALLKVLMLPGSAKVPVVMQNEDDVVVGAKNFHSAQVTPIFLVSCVTGENLDLLVKFLNLLPSRSANQSMTAESLDKDAEFHVEDLFSVPDVGIVAAGRLISGQISAMGNQSLVIGPMESGNFAPVEVTSIHRQRRPVKFARVGQSVSLALKNVEREQLRKGMVILQGFPGCKPCSYVEFEAIMLVLYAPPEYTVLNLKCMGQDPSEADTAPACNNKRKRNLSFSSKRSSPSGKQARNGAPAEATEDTSPTNNAASIRIRSGRTTGTVHIGSISQPCQLLGFVPDESVADQLQQQQRIIQSGERIHIRYRLLRYPEYLSTGSRVLFRDGDQGAKMVGEIVELNFVKGAVDVVAPPVAKSSLDMFREHWRHIKDYYQTLHDGEGHMRNQSRGNVQATNIPFHMEAMVKYITEEELEELARSQSSLIAEQQQQNEPMTGPCLEELLQKRILEALVAYAEMDVPTGMRVSVLRVLSLLLSNVHHRILPEASVRIPVERLVRLSHEIEDVPPNADTKQEMVKLILAVFRQLLVYPALVNLFLEHQRNSDTGKLDFDHVRFPMFSYLMEHMAANDPDMAVISREAILIGLQICSMDDRLAQFVVTESHMGDMVVERLIIFFSVIPVKPQSAISSPSSRAIHPASETESLSPSALWSDFYDYWMFFNQLLKSCPGSYPGSAAIRKYLISHVIKTFFDGFLYGKLVKSTEESVTAVYIDYLSSMMRVVGNDRLISCILTSLFAPPVSSDPGKFCEILSHLAVSSQEKVSLAPLKLMDACLQSFNYDAFRYLVYSSESVKAQAADSMDFFELNGRLEALLQLSEEGNAPSPDEDTLESPVPRLEAPPLNFGGTESLSNYEHYFADAQEWSQLCTDQYYRWNRAAEKEYVWSGAPVLFDSVLQRFSGFFENSVERNLLITSILSKICLLPDANVQKTVVTGRILEPLQRLMEEARERARSIPGFRRRLDVVRRYCGDDTVRILDRINVTAEEAGEQGESTLGSLLNMALDWKLHSNEEPRPENETVTKLERVLTRPDVSSDRKMVAFGPAYVVLHEYAKELTAILFIVSRTMEMAQADQQ